MINYYMRKNPVVVAIIAVAIISIIYVIFGFSKELVMALIVVIAVALTTTVRQTQPVQWFTMDPSVTAALQKEPNHKKTWTEVQDGVLYQMRGFLPTWMVRYEIVKNLDAIQLIKITLGVRNPVDLAYSQKPEVDPLFLISRMTINTGDKPYNIAFWVKGNIADKITGDLITLINIASGASDLTRFGSKPKMS